MASTERAKISRKGAAERTSKQRLGILNASSQTFRQEALPSKNVHFRRNLIMGPADPLRRSQSPIRSALHRSDCMADSPSAQLQLEQDQAELDAVRLEGKRSKEGNARSQLHVDANSRKAIPQKHNTRSSGTGEEGLYVRKPGHHSPTDFGIHEGFIDGCKTQKGTTDDAQTPFDSPNEFFNIFSKPNVKADSRRRHARVCDQLNELVAMIRDYAEDFPAVHAPDVLDSLLVEENEQLVMYMSCLATGGRAGVEGWRKLLEDTTCRHALVFGIIGRALKEHVFDHLCFGAEPQFLAKLHEIEKLHLQKDGLYRKDALANEINRNWKSIIPRISASQATARITAQLEKLLLPLWNQGRKSETWVSSRKQRRLIDIVEHAAHLSLEMRRDRNTVYYWPPTFKDEEFNANHMECYNLYSMMQESPYDRSVVNGIDRAALQEGLADRSEAIVRVVCFPGLVAYQKGGGDLAERELAEERGKSGGPARHREDASMQGKRVAGPKAGAPEPDHGFRTRTLCKSVVLLEWGRQRLLTKEAGTSLFLDAVDSDSKKYEEDYVGFVELYDLYLEAAAREATARLPPRPNPPSWARIFSGSPSVLPHATP